MYYDEYAEKYENEILTELEDTVENMNITRWVKDRLIDVIQEYSFEIVDYRYQQSRGEYEDRCYDEFKDSKLNL